MRAVTLLHIEQAYDEKRTDWFYKNYHIDIDNWPEDSILGSFMCWRCHEEGREEANFTFTDVHAVIDHVNAYHKKFKKRELR